MVEIKKKEKYTNFKSIDGHTLKLYIDNKPISLRIIVLNSRKALCRQCIVLLLLVTLETIFLTFNVGFYNIIVVIPCVILLGYRILITAIEESLVIVKGLGIHIETNYILGTKALFIPQEQVQNIFINEVILRNKVVFMLTLSTSDDNTKESLVPLFVETLPRLGLLTVVYNLTRKLI